MALVAKIPWAEPYTKLVQGVIVLKSSPMPKSGKGPTSKSEPYKRRNTFHLLGKLALLAVGVPQLIICARDARVSMPGPRRQSSRQTATVLSRGAERETSTSFEGDYSHVILYSSMIVS